MLKKDYILKGVFYSVEVENTVKDVFREIEEVSYDGYICDIIHDFTDSAVPIYHSELIDAVKDLDSYCTDVVAEGLYVVDSQHQFDLDDLLKSAYYELIEHHVYENLDTILFNRGVDVIDEYVREKDITLTEERENELEYQLEMHCEGYDTTSSDISVFDDECKELVDDILVNDEGEVE